MIRGLWNPPKKDTSYPKTKKKPQQDGGRDTIKIKSNLLPAVWVTHKLENYTTKEVLPFLGRFQTPHQGSQPGDPTMGLGIPSKSDLEDQWELTIGLPQDWGKQTPVLDGTNKILCAPRPRGKEQ